MSVPSYDKKVQDASKHLDALEASIQGWLGGDAYRIVAEHDPDTRRTEIVTRITGDVPDWSMEIGVVAHQIRSALDHLALALNSRGYADANKGASLPIKGRNASEYPIFGDVDSDGNPGQGSALFKKAKRRYRNMPPGAQGFIESVQPYNAGPVDYLKHPLWIVHELDRVDKHQEPLAVVAAIPSGEIRLGGPGQSTAITDAQIGGFGGPTYDGQVLSCWTGVKGHAEPDAEGKFTRDVTFGEGTPVPGQPVIGTLRHVWEQCNSAIITPLKLLL